MSARPGDREGTGPGRREGHGDCDRDRDDAAAPPFDSSPWQAADALLGLDEPAAAADIADIPIALRRRRGFRAADADRRASLALVADADGVLRWQYAPPPAPGRTRRAGRAGPGVREADVVQRFRYADIGPNQVTQALARLDARLTPCDGLRRWDGAALLPAGRPPDGAGADGAPCLLLVHGTFSHSGMWFTELAATAAGRALLAQWRATYGARIYAFDHPTLSLPPWLNALALDPALRGLAGPIDIVCHSRGGLVVSWLLRLVPLRARRIVFVGAPLDGTSLASPARLRGALDRLANAANALALAGAAAATVLPLAAGAAGLAKVLGRTLWLGANLPLVDAAVAIVPGLASQQRTSDNAELRQLFAERWLARPRCAAVSADFEPDADLPAWAFWRRLREAAQRGAAAAAAQVFPGANDLVVDTDAMTRFGQPLAAPAEVLALARGPQTFHTNYFRDPRVIAFIAERTA